MSEVGGAREVLLIRHGETAWNAERRLQGQLDVPLNLHGRRQAAALAAALRNEPLDALYASDLQRARQTAAAIAAVHKIPLQLDAGLRERCYGAFEGLLYDEIAARFPAAHAAWQAREIDAAFPPAPGGDARAGETLREFARRALAAVERMAAAATGRRIAIVTHGGVLEMVYRSVRAIGHGPARDFEIPNAGVNRLVRDSGGWRIDSWADVAHLRQLAVLDEIDA